MENIVLIWVVVSALLFAVAALSTIQDDIELDNLLWLAVLAVLWPLIVIFCAIGLLFALLASFARDNSQT